MTAGAPGDTGPPRLGALRAALGAFQAIGRNRDIALLELSWTLSVGASWVFLVGALVLAYRIGGPAAVGLVGLARMLAATVTAPLVVVAERRLRADRLLVATHAARAALAGLACVGLLAGVPAVLLLPIIAVKAAAGVFVRPTTVALLPALSRTPDELVASNVASSTGEGLGTLVGPAVGGFLVAAFGLPVTAAAGAVALLAALACAAAVRPTADALIGQPPDVSPLQLVRAGLSSLAERPSVRLVMACFFAQTIVRGMLSVLLVVAAIELLGLGESGVGLLNATIGLGGFAGAAVALTVAGGNGLSRAFRLALVGWGLPIAAIGLVPAPSIALAVFVLLGASNAVLDVAGLTLLQRLVPNGQRMAVLGLLEALVGIGISLGSVACPLVLGALGIRATLLLAGAILPAIAVVGWASLSRVDESVVVAHRELALLRGVPMFAPLPLTVTERLAGQLARIELASGFVLTRQGEPADCFYVLESGAVEVSQDGRLLRRCDANSAVGEIGLLRRMPRTATVVTVEPTVAYALSGDDFLAAVTGNPASVEAAEGVVSSRLAYAGSEAQLGR